MTIGARIVDYEHKRRSFEGLLAQDDALPSPRPGVLVFPDWRGRSSAQEQVAAKLATWGYAAFAVDLYGKGIRGTTPEQCEGLMTPFISDRAMLRERLLHTLEIVRELRGIDAHNIAAVGFCFGGLCALDLARAGAPVKAVASFHGLFTPPGLPIADPIESKVIAFHGWNDPLAPPADIVALGRELTAARADWQIHAYGGTMHAFTVEDADNSAAGILYNERSAGRAWAALRGFLAEACG